MRAVRVLFGRELSLAWGGGGGPLLACGFMLCLTAILPLAAGGDPRVLAPAASGASWMALALASLLSLERLFERDLEDGALDLLALGPLPQHADQFNAIHEALVERFGELARQLPPPLYFSAVGSSEEDRGTVDYLRDCASQAGLHGQAIAIEDIGLSEDGRFTALDDSVIGTLFKLYPLEDLMAEEFGRALPGSGVQLLEPAWKAVLSNKGILPLLWQRNVGHPNLLEAHFDDGSTLAPGWVRKPLFSREGANIEIHLADGSTQRSDGPYDGPAIIQRAHPLTRFEGGYPLIGSWVVGDHACGIGIREDDSAITRDSARFVPHAIVDEAPTRIYV